MPQAPRAYNRDIFTSGQHVYYGTDDGSIDGSFKEFETIESHYKNVESNRKENIHMISVIGGLYGLNLIHLWKPKEITFFDINPMAVKYFKIILKVWISSISAEDFLNRLTEGDYETNTDDEEFIKENIQMVQKTGSIPRERGALSSHNRDLANSWRKALENFEETRRLLTEAKINIRTEPMEGNNFRDMIRTNSHHWIYASNITQFHFFELEILEPSNVVLLQIHHEDVQLLDLCQYAENPVCVKFEYPITVETL